MQTCSTNRMWMHQEAHVTPFTCAEGAEGWRAGLCVAPINSPHVEASARRFSVAAGAREDLLQLWQTLRCAVTSAQHKAQGSADCEGWSWKACLCTYSVSVNKRCMCTCYMNAGSSAGPWKSCDACRPQLVMLNTERFTSKRTLTYRDCELIKWTQPTGTTWNCELTLETFTMTWTLWSLYMVLPLVDCSKCEDQYCLPFSLCFCLLKSRFLPWKRG